MNVEGMDLTNQLCLSIYKVSHLFTRFYQQTLEQYNLTYTQYIVLLALWEKDYLSVTQLGERLDLDSNTLTPLLKRLESTGWITRTRSSVDGRQLIISLTDKGVNERLDILQTVASCVGQSELDFDQYKVSLEINNSLINKLSKVIDC